jgi:hypothetical protein
MGTKVCSKCNKEKEICKFSKDSQKKDGLHSSCKVCVNNRVKIYKEKNPEKVKESKQKHYLKNKEKYSNLNQKWKEKNPEYMTTYSKHYYIEHKEMLIERSKNYYETNKGELLEKFKEYVKNNFEKTSDYQKKYRENNKEKLQNYRYFYNKNRRKNDTLFNLKNSVSHRVREFLKVKNISKTNKTFEIVGCSPQFLKEHLESQFIDGMTWENRSEWHIDHIIPLSSAKTEDELYMLCHYKNLQPLWAEDNLKKSNKIIV